MTSSFDVIIVGNGVIGNSIGYEIARRSGSLRIAVCGPKRRTGAASAAAGAMLNTFGEVTKYTLKSEAGRAKFDLCRLALDMWPAWLEELKDISGQSDLDRSLTHGTTVICNAKSGVLDDQNFAALQAALTKFDEPHEEIDPQCVVGLRPLPDARPLRAIHIAREGAIDARAVLGGLELAAESLGVTVLDAEIVDIAVRAGAVVGVTLGDGSLLEGEMVILAAGAFSGQLARMFEPGAVPVLFAGRGISMMVRRPMEPGFQYTVRSPTRAGACGLHVVPLGDGIDYYGATNEVYDLPSALADFGNSQLLMKYACEQLDMELHNADIERWIVGNRPIAVDGFPLIGRTSIDGLILATGTYRDGFHCSPAIAQFVADDVVGVDSLADRLPIFVPERPPIETLTPSESVMEFIFQGVSGEFEAGVTVPGWHTDMKIFADFYGRVAERYYALFDEPIGLLHEMLISVMYSPNPEKHSITEYIRAARGHYSGATLPSSD